MWRRGFLSESWVLYDLARNDWRPYLSDYARFTRTRLINGSYAVVLDNKLIFDRFVGGSCAAVPRIQGILRQGRMLDPTGKTPGCTASRGVMDELHRAGALVLKPLTGGGGRGLAMLRLIGDDVTLNGTVVNEDDLRRYVESCDNMMVCAFVAQHPTLARLYRHTTNTVRLLTIQDDACDAAVIAAVLRVGTDRSVPTDNWSRGGLSARVDVDTGQVGRAVGYPAGADRLSWHATHPASGEAIEGVSIPHWDRIRTGVLEIFRALPVLKYVGWDIVVTEDGFRILEGNNYSDVNLLQVHGPLLADERVRAFYQRHGVL
jgi:hypothetical protein